MDERTVHNIVTVILIVVFSFRRTGASCNDGTSSCATGHGACSHHGGVRHWRYGR